MSKESNVLGVKCPELQMSWVSNVQGFKCLGRQMSKASNVLGVKGPGAKVSRFKACVFFQVVGILSSEADLRTGCFTGKYLFLNFNFFQTCNRVFYRP